MPTLCGHEPRREIPQPAVVVGLKGVAWEEGSRGDGTIPIGPSCTAGAKDPERTQV